MWWTITALSVVVNIFFVWYIRELLIRFSYMGTETDKIYTDLQTYEDHLSTVYDLPVFYGDSTLSELLKHTSEVRDLIGTHKEIFNLEENVLPDEQEEEEDA
jgi:hypothetical protein